MSAEGRGPNLEDHTCPICFRFFWDPQTTPCRHKFCRRCAVKSLERNRAICPLCRGSLEGWIPELLPPDENYVLFLQLNFPAQYLEREREELEEALEEQHKRRLRILIGNLHEYVPNAPGSNKHRWTFFVRAEDESVNLAHLIDHVVVFLHPTFHPSRIELTTPPYSFTRIGWGVFELHVRLVFRPSLQKDPAEVVHMLSFTGHGAATVYTLEYDARNVSGSSTPTTPAVMPSSSSSPALPPAPVGV